MRTNANVKMWDIIDRCREGNIKNFGEFYGDKLVKVSSEVTSVYSERIGNKYINGTVEFGAVLQHLTMSLLSLQRKYWLKFLVSKNFKKYFQNSA
jgi:hypothetical protein